MNFDFLFERVDIIDDWHNYQFGQALSFGS